MVERTAKEHPNLCAYVFFGRRTSYARLLEKIGECARALRANGISKGDKAVSYTHLTLPTNSLV